MEIYCLNRGLYDYKYVWLNKDTGKIDQAVFEGSFWDPKYLPGICLL
ncbi:hypothetical protein [Pedobacter steynii]